MKSIFIKEYLMKPVFSILLQIKQTLLKMKIMEDGKKLRLYDIN